MRARVDGVAAARRGVVDAGTSSPSRPCRETRCANERACALDVNEETALARSATGPAEEEAHARVAARVAAVDRRDHGAAFAAAAPSDEDDEDDEDERRGRG